MNRWGVLVLMSLSTFIIVIDTTIMNVSISNLVADLNTTVGGIQTAIALYALVMAALMMTGGKLAEMYASERARAFQASMLFLTFVSALGLALTSGLPRGRLVEA